MRQKSFKKRAIWGLLVTLTLAPALTFAAGFHPQLPSSCNTPLERQAFMEWMRENGAPESFPCESDVRPESSEPVSRPELPLICNTPLERQAFIEWVLRGGSSEPMPCVR